ncbi:MAG: hypothetical protein ACJ8CR_36000, partial [Roseiflexaceae bacterium]
MRKILFAIPMILLVLSACGQAAPQASQPTAAPALGTTPPAPTIAPTTPPAPTAAPTVATAPPTSAPLPATSGAPTPGGNGTSVRPPDALVTTAQQRLAQHLGVSADTLMLQSANHQEWPDGAIGCPKPGQLYP